MQSLTWITNVPAPYREPLYDQLRRRFSLRVLFMEERHDLREWVRPSRPTYDVRVLRAPRLRLRDERTFYVIAERLGPLLRGVDAVVIGGWESPAYWQALLSARLAHLPVVAFYESNLASRRFTTGPLAAARRFFWSKCDAIVCVGAASRDALYADRVPQNKVFQGHNVVDVDWWSSAVAVRRMPRRARGHSYCFVGRLIERKNVGGLIEAFARVRQPNDELHIVGEGHLRAALEAQAATMAGAAVTFYGNLPPDGVAAVLACSQTLVLPSVEEVYGLVVNEALSSGLQVVVSSAAGVAREVCGHEGVVVADPTVTGLSTALSAAKNAWCGPVDDPVVRSWDAAALANVVASAVNSVGRR
jgi:glycosyltransferase involved in cell wall biosynthesis